MGANDYAIVVGISRYPALGNLGGPEADALDFYEWLVDAKGGNVPQGNVTRILSSDYEPVDTFLKAKPQIVDVENVLDNYFLIGQEKAVVGDRLYLYFAGHGFAPSLEDAALLMANAARGATGYHIPGRPYANWFRQAAYFNEVVLFMDCCRENYQLTKPRHPPYDPVNGPKPGERYYGFATEWSRDSREGPWGENGTTRGLFTLALLAGLRGGALKDANGRVSGEALESYVINFVRRTFKDEDEKAAKAAAAAGEEPPIPEEHPDPEFDYKKTANISFNPPPGEPPSNPLDDVEFHDDSGALESLSFEGDAPPSPPAKTYTIRLALENGDAGKAYELATNDEIVIPPSSQTAGEWLWNIETAGLYKITSKSDNVSKLFEVIGEKEIIDVSLD